jgi:UDP-N-acetylmuramate dehydrogenase
LALAISHDIPLAPLTTLELGGPARHLIVAEDDGTVVEALRWAAARALAVLVLGGGSNLVVADTGFPGLVIRMATRGISFDDAGAGAGAGEVTLMQVAAGEPWDGVVAETVRRGLAGLECLSGIPGLAGATPIQNVGAYGQEVAESIRAVRVVDRQTLDVRELPAEACAFGYRASAFKREPDRWVVLGVTFALRRDGAPAVRYAELERALAAGLARAPAAATPARATLAGVRDTVLALRRAKSMVIDPGDPNRRSVGSFFMNPIVPADHAARLVARLVAEGLVHDAAGVPQFPGGGDRVKLSAAWLIERAGLGKGYRDGAVGISSRHALALVHHGGGTTAALLALADRVRDAVEHRFGVRLEREPVVVG